MGLVFFAKKVEEVVEGAEGSRWRRPPAMAINNELNDIVFSWSIEDILNENLYKNQRMGRTWAFASVTKISDDESEGDFASVYFKVVTWKKMGDIKLEERQLFAISLGVNLTTHIRIWTALHLSRNWNVLKEVLCTDSSGEEECSLCTVPSDDFCRENLTGNLLNHLNESQAEAILTCLRKIRCRHKPVLELIWGPPGTGKTKVTAIMLLSLLRMKRRTVVCAPTNVAVIEIASRLVHLMRGSASLGDVLLFGNKERLKPPQLLVINEAAQMKECESVIPLQLLGLRHAILVGDDRQLPAVVMSDNKWRVAHEYMKGRKLLDNSFIGRYPQFKPARHNGQFAGAMLDYWRKLSLIQCDTEKLDSSRHNVYTTWFQCPEKDDFKKGQTKKKLERKSCFAYKIRDHGKILRFTILRPSTDSR
ncbi:hypothetical protein CRG98_046005 [Punica granatum]|uniref:DNA2/NAM7 helicase helicase domain-containing protein n=1 Tax=Punica granatum TaxID=22663 RepID=A0A2I0HPV2_PUNGR|nr:hypothetical protein CRG98_046005 [Punica granatum]